MRSSPRVAALLLGGFCALGMLCGAEVAFYFINQHGQLDEHNSAPMFQPDLLLGYKAYPNTRITSRKVRQDGTLIYDVSYSTDAHGRRVTPREESHRRATGLIVYFGCSFTFGEGVNDDETMPSGVSRLAPDYLPYNYGFRGYGPQQMLATLQSGTLTKEVDRAAHEMALYTFIDDHVLRAIGSVRVLFFARDHPYYTLDRDGGLVRNGSFLSGRPATTLFYRAMARSQTLKFLGVDWPMVTESHIRLTAGMIAESRRLFREQFGGSEFYVLIYPGSTRYGKRLIPYLERAGIAYLDYSESAVERIPYDRHPTPNGHRAVAAKLVADLRLRDRE